MAIAKGRTNCKAERDLILQGLREQLQILVKSQIQQENLFKARLNEIITDNSLTSEEEYALRCPWTNQLQELEECHIRIRRSIFIGLYSFWEVSLMDIVNTHVPALIVRKSNKSKNLGVSDYLKLIYGDTLPSSAYLIDNNVREFRNYMVHGTLTEKRKLLINELVSAHTEFCVKDVGQTYIISNYKGLFEMLTLLSKELDLVENKIIENKNNIK